MKGRTYRYLESEPLYPFGYGLSYSSFRYEGLSLSSTSIPAGRDLAVTVMVTNTGSIEADEVVQVYLSDLEASVRIPRWQLSGFSRVRLPPGRSAPVTFTLTPRHMSLIDEKGSRLLEPGRFRVFVGGSQPDSRSAALAGARPLSAEFSVTGDEVRLP
jgi:beta-glucosidase